MMRCAPAFIVFPSDHDSNKHISLYSSYISKRLKLDYDYPGLEWDYMAAEDNDQRFEDFLNQLSAKERLIKEQSLSVPTANYNEWAWHYELAKRQFTGLWEVFRKIEGSVPNWGCETSISSECDESQVEQVSQDPPLLNVYKDADKWGYYFSASLIRDPTKSMQISRMLHFDLPYLGSEKDFVGEDKVRSELYGLEIVKEKPWFEEVHTGKLIDCIDNCRLNIGILHKNVEDLDYEFPDFLKEYIFRKSFGIGFLYDHDLAEVGKQLFMLMNKPHMDDSELEAVLPDGDYSRRPMPADDNTIIHDTDPKWRNE
jgi:hypothetical protein